MAKIADVVKAVAGVVDSVLNVLPAAWAVKVRSARKAVVAVAGAVLSVLTAVQVVPLPTGWSTYVAYVFAAATAVVTYFTPNAAAKP